MARFHKVTEATVTSDARGMTPDDVNIFCLELRMSLRRILPRALIHVLTHRENTTIVLNGEDTYSAVVQVAITETAIRKKYSPNTHKSSHLVVIAKVPDPPHHDHTINTPERSDV